MYQIRDLDISIHVKIVYNSELVLTEINQEQVVSRK